MNNLTRRELENSQVINSSTRRWAVDNLDYLNRPMKLFGQSIKTLKGSKKRESWIIYLQPSTKVSTKTLCTAAAAAGCERPCLIESGMLALTTGQKAATKRTILMLMRPCWFEAQLLREIDAKEKRAKRTGIPALFRLNGTSDLDWSHIISQRPGSAFYDYTKILGRVRRNTLPNYDLTFSGSMYSVQSRAMLKKAVSRGDRVAVAFNTAGMKTDSVQIPVRLLDFDATDLRPLDPKGIGALKRKGSSRAERAEESLPSFFVTADNLQQFNEIANGG